MVEIRIIPYFAVIEIENKKKVKMMEKLITSQTVSETEKSILPIPREKDEKDGPHKKYRFKSCHCRISYPEM